MNNQHDSWTSVREELARSMCFRDTNPELHDQIWAGMRDDEQPTNTITDIVVEHGRDWWRSAADAALSYLRSRQAIVLDPPNPSPTEREHTNERDRADHS